MTSPGSSSQAEQHFQLDLDAAHRIKSAVTDLEGVAGLSAGSFGEVSLLFAGDRVSGIRKPSPREDTVIEIHVVVDVAAAHAPQDPLADIRIAAMPPSPDLALVDVIFADATSGTHAYQCHFHISVTNEFL